MNIPQSRKEMLKHKDSASYIIAETIESESFIALEVLKLCERPEHHGVMKARWVYDRKYNLDGELIFKARIVAKGFIMDQGRDYNEVFSPTMQIKIFRALL